MTPNKIHLHKKTQILDITFGQKLFQMRAEFLRVQSPSAEVKGHAGEGGRLPVQKKNVQIQKLEPAGNYALRIHFDDGHTSGLYTWQYLYELGENQQQLWQAYLDKLNTTQQTREPEAQVLQFTPNN